MIDQQS